jgi:cell division protein FtsB
MNIRRVVGKVQSHITINNGVLFIALLIGFSWMWSTVEAIQRNFKLQQQVDAMSQQNAVQELENKSQALQNKYYQSPEYMELSARERLNKSAPGEHVIILPQNTVKPAPESDIAVVTEEPITARSNFAQWMYFLFGKKR